jgi:hypothetical protein
VFVFVSVCPLRSVAETGTVAVIECVLVWVSSSLDVASTVTVNVRVTLSSPLESMGRALLLLSLSPPL